MIWCMGRGRPKNKHRKATCLAKHWTRLSNLSTTSRSKVNTIGEDICIQIRNQRTCTSNKLKYNRGGPLFSLVFVDVSL